MIILQAKFVGKDSLGFKSGLNYNLRFEVTSAGMTSAVNYKPVASIDGIRISTNSGKFPDYNRLNCDYSSVERFLDNWQVVKINLFSTELPELVKSTIHSKLTSSMRDVKLKQLI